MTEDCLLSERGSYYKINVFIHDGERDRNKELGRKEWGVEHLTVWIQRAISIRAKEQVSRGVWVCHTPCLCTKKVASENAVRHKSRHGNAKKPPNLNSTFCCSLHEAAVTMIAHPTILEWWIPFLRSVMQSLFVCFCFFFIPTVFGYITVYQVLILKNGEINSLSLAWLDSFWSSGPYTTTMRSVPNATQSTGNYVTGRYEFTKLLLLFD